MPQILSHFTLTNSQPNVKILLFWVVPMLKSNYYVKVKTPLFSGVLIEVYLVLDLFFEFSNPF